jgi:hypothetical protein
MAPQGLALRCPQNQPIPESERSRLHQCQGDLKHFRIRHFLTHGCVKTRTALLDVSEVKARNIRDRLNMIVAGKVGVGSAVEIVVVSGNGVTFWRVSA